MKSKKALTVFFSIFAIAAAAILSVFNQATQPPPTNSQQNTPLAATNPLEGEKRKVARVVDGDTVELEDGSKVRYLGVDTPETVDPRKSVECFGKEAKEENKQLVEGKEVILQKDVSETDKYHRLLRYVFVSLEPGAKYLFVNDYLIRQGFAHFLTIPPDVKYSESLLQAQREAREAKKGLWGRC